MNTQSDPQNELSSVLQKICEIAEKSVDGDYIFRGESRSYGKVVSSLYRQYEYDIEADDFEIEFVQKEILDGAKKYTEETDELEILVELHYHGGVTNLIEFTTDSHIALFFACDGAPSEDGRVILQKRDSVAGYLEQSRKLKNRIISQKSIFVRPPKGFINPDEVITIPADLKLPMLEYLRKSHGISTETIYNDFRGFMTNRSIHEGAYTQFHKGRASQKRGDATQNWNEKLTWYERAVVHYTEALELKPDFPEGYNNRGTVYADAGDFDRAIQDHNTAIELKPDYASAYNNRGIAYYRKGDFNRAIQDYNKAIELKPDYASAYNNRGIAYSKQGYNNRGIAYSAKNKLGDAIRDFGKAIELNPNYIGAYNNLGNVYSIKGEYDKAITEFNKAIELNPHNADAYNNRGSVYGITGELDKAIQDFSKAIGLNPCNAAAYNNLGRVYGIKGEYDRAIQNCNIAIKVEANYARAYCNRGIVWLHLKEWEEARTDLNLAKDKGVDIIVEFHDRYESVEDFEQKSGVQLPEDIKAMLTQR